MGRGRMEAFSDGVIAIIITIMVLQLQPPRGGEIAALRPLIPTFLSYVISFVFVGIYWNNHHHLLSAVKMIDGKILWANLHLLFWISLLPFTTAWMGENSFSSWPVAVYGADLLMAGVAYYILTRFLICYQGDGSTLSKAVGGDLKGKISLAIYAAAIPIAFFLPAVAVGMYVVVAVMWLVPDRRIEKAIAK